MLLGGGRGKGYFPRPSSHFDRVLAARRGARVVDRDGLENRCARKGTVGSNPTLSANTFYPTHGPYPSFVGFPAPGISAAFQSADPRRAASRPRGCTLTETCCPAGTALAANSIHRAPATSSRSRRC